MKPIKNFLHLTPVTSITTAFSALHAEAQALHHAIFRAFHNLDQIECHTDFQILINLLGSFPHIYSPIASLILDIVQVGSLFTFCSIKKVGRNQVAKAHTIATYARINRYALSLLQ